jgi:hypothetical protein
VIQITVALDVKLEISTRWLANPNRGRSHFPHDFGAHMNILVFTKRSYMFPQLCQILSLEWLSNFEHAVQSL